MSSPSTLNIAPFPSDKAWAHQEITRLAVLAERERCAKLAEESRCHEENCEHEACLRAIRIAQQIRDSK